MFPWIIQFVLPLGIANLALPFLISYSKRKSILDFPDPAFRNEDGRAQKSHVEPVPRLGGVVLVLAFLGALPFVELNSSIFKLVAGGLAMFMLGFIDDLKALPAATKLIAQLLIAFILVYSANLSLSRFSFAGIELAIGHYVGLALSSILIVGVLNSINMIDGLDGLAAGISLIGISLLSYSYFLESRETWILLTLTVSIFGSVVGFLKFNTFPARIFMGDGGSHWLGFLCGVLLIIAVGGFRPDSAGGFRIVFEHQTDLLTGITCLALPIGDTIALAIYRLKSGGHPFRADNSHMHHILRSNGYSQRRSVVALYTIALAIGFLGLMPVIYPAYWDYWLSFTLLIAFCSYLYLKKEAPIFRKGFRGKVSARVLSALLSVSKDRINPNLYRYWLISNRIAIYILLLSAPFFSSPSNLGLGKFQVLAFVVLSFTALVKVKKRDFTASLLISLSIAVALLSLNQYPLSIAINGTEYSVQGIYNAYFVGLGLSVVGFFLYDASLKGFRFSSTDFLLIVLPLMLVLVPEPYNSQYYISVTSLRAAVFFLALRTVFFGSARALKNIRLVTLLSLLHLIGKQFLNIA